MSLLHVTLITYETIRFSVLQQRLYIMQIWVKSNPEDRKEKLFVYTLMAFKGGLAEKWIWIRFKHWRKQVQSNQVLQHKTERKYHLYRVPKWGAFLLLTNPTMDSIEKRRGKNRSSVTVVIFSNGIFGITSTIEMYSSNILVRDSSPSMPFLGTYTIVLYLLPSWLLMW